MPSCQKDGFFECLCLLTLKWTCTLPVNICLLKISTQKWLWLCAVPRLAFHHPPASAWLFKTTCSIIWLRIPWQRTLALDLPTSFPGCDNHPLEPSMESNIMVICWGHCCELILQQTSQRHINHCWCRVFQILKKVTKFSLKSHFHLWNFWRTVHPGDKHDFPYKHLILCVAITLWCHIWHLFQAQRHYLQL